MSSFDKREEGFEKKYALDEEQFAQFVFENPAQLFLGQNPHFFDGTSVSGDI